MNNFKVPYKPKLREGVFLLDHPEGLQIKAMHQDLVLRGRVAGELIPKIVSLFDSGLTAFEIAGKLKTQSPDLEEEVVLQALQVLNDHFLLEEASSSSSAPDARFNFFSYFSYDKQAVQEKLKTSSLALITCGESGKKVADYLSPMDLGELNIFEEGEIGNLEELIGHPNLLLVCLETPRFDLLRKINTLALKRELKWTRAILHSFVAEIGPTVIPFRSPCYQCFDLRLKSTRCNYEEYLNYEKFAQSGKIKYFSLPLLQDLFAACVALESLKLLTDFQAPLSLANLLVFDLIKMEIQSHPVLKLPHCPACGKGTFLPSKRNYLKNWAEIEGNHG